MLPATTNVCKTRGCNYSSWWWAVCRSKHVGLLRNIGIINSTTRSHLVGYFCKIYIMMHWFTLWCTDLHYNALIYIMMHWFTLRCTDLNYDALIYIMMHWFTLWCTDLYYDALIYIMMHWFTLWCTDPWTASQRSFKNWEECISETHFLHCSTNYTHVS